VNGGYFEYTVFRSAIFSDSLAIGHKCCPLHGIQTMRFTVLKNVFPVLSTLNLEPHMYRKRTFLCLFS